MQIGSKYVGPRSPNSENWQHHRQAVQSTRRKSRDRARGLRRRGLAPAHRRSTPSLRRASTQAAFAGNDQISKPQSEAIVDSVFRRWKADLVWCREQGKDYLPVAYPGFSWHNSHSGSPLNEIPRDQGKFLWQQYVELKRLGVQAIYQAMFDEIHEGTAIFKWPTIRPSARARF